MNTSPAEPLQRDFWPLTRLLIVGAALAAWYRPSWPAGTSVGRLVELGGAALFASGTLAQVYLALLLAPLLMAILLNDWLYDGAAWCMGHLAGIKTSRGARLAALSIELLAFLLIAEALRHSLAQVV